MFTTFRNCTVIIAVMTMVASGASAAIMAYEGFATDATGSGDNYLASVVLGSYSGYTGPNEVRTGFTGTWSALAAAVNATAEMGSPLSYSGFATGDDGYGQPYRSSGPSGTMKRVERSLDVAAVSDYYVAALIDFNGSSGGGFSFGRGTKFSYLRSDGNYVTFQGAGQSGGSYSTPLTEGTHLIVIHYTTGEGVSNPNTLYYTEWEIWIDPNIVDAQLPATPDATGLGVGVYFSGGKNPLALDHAELLADYLQSGETAKVDELYIATSPDDFLVPEPGTMSMIAFGGVALFWRKRKR